jgi:hypothetical protein
LIPTRIGILFRIGSAFYILRLTGRNSSCSTLNKTKPRSGKHGGIGLRVLRTSAGGQTMNQFAAHLIVGIPSILFWSNVSVGADFPCPQPTLQVASGIAGDMQGQAQGLLRLATAELKGQIQTTVVNLWEKYPNADKIAIVQNFQSTSCNILKTSTSLSDEKKLELWMAMIPTFVVYLSPPNKP